MKINTYASGSVQNVSSYSRDLKKQDSPVSDAGRLQNVSKEDAYKVSISNESVDMIRAAKDTKTEKVNELQQQQTIQVQATKELDANKSKKGLGSVNQRIDLFA